MVKLLKADRLLTKQQLKRIEWVPIANAARWSHKGSPYITHRSTIRMQGEVVRCFLLDNGSCVLDALDVRRSRAVLVQSAASTR